MADRNAVNAFTSFATMAAVYPSVAQASNQTLPFVTIDGFDKLAAGFLKVSKASAVCFGPLLESAADLQRWNVYSVTHTHWIAEGRQDQKTHGQGNASNEFVPFVFEYDANYTPIPRTGDGPFCPSWQMSPIPDRLHFVNSDDYTNDVTRVSMEYARTTGQTSLTEPLPGLREYFALDIDGPISLLHEPVYNDTSDKSPREVVGFLTGILGWITFFNHLLPTGQGSILVVIDSCSINSTFLINGPEATFLADGDHHDPRYDSMAHSHLFVGSTINDTNSANQQCTHVVYVFPTKELEEEYYTNYPALNAVLIVVIFVFAGVVFVAYDYFVTNRQTRTETQANQSNAIVQELFPGDVAARLFANQENGGTTGLKQGLGKADQTTIAELHPEATVLCKSQFCSHG
jgi:CHASE domain